MCAALSALETCDLILGHVKTSSLNFSIQETPFSVYLTLRKSFNQSSRRFSNPETYTSSSNPTQSKETLEKLETELQNLRFEQNLLKAKNDDLEKANEDLAKKYEDEVIESEHLLSRLQDQRGHLDNLQTLAEKTHSPTCCV